MKSWKAILAIGVIFVTGFLTGAVVVKKMQSPASRVPPEEFLQGPAFIQHRFLGRMKSELKLTEQQTRNLEKIFTDSRERIRILMDIIGPEMKAELTAVRDGIKKELTPEQHKKFEELMRRVRRGRFGGRPPKDVHRKWNRSDDAGHGPRRNESEPGKDKSHRQPANPPPPPPPQ